MKAPILIAIFTLALTPSFEAQAATDRSVEDCQTKVEFLFSKERSDLERERSTAGVDKISLDMKIQRLNMEIAGAKAACNEEAKEEHFKARPDDEYKHPRRMDDDTSEVDFQNLQYYPPEEG